MSNSRTQAEQRLDHLRVQRRDRAEGVIRQYRLVT
jgi:hypothetical protein